MMIPRVDPPPGAAEVTRPGESPPAPEMPAPEMPAPEMPAPEMPAPGAALCHEPSDAELAGLWPDPFAGPPEDGPDEEDGWLAELSVAEVSAAQVSVTEMDAIWGTGTGSEAACESGFADGGLLDGLEPGPALAGFSQGVLDDGFAGLSDDELVGLLRASRRLSSWQAGVELAAVAELDARRMRAAARPGWSRISEHVSEELAASLVLTGRSADSLLGLARDLVRLPAVLRALLAGRIDRARAMVFAAELSGLSDLAAAAVAMAYLAQAGSMTTSQLRAALRSMVLYLDPQALRRRAEKGRADARVESWQEGSGNGALAGRELPPAEMIAADERISAIARSLKEAGAAGTMDQLRAAVFTALLAGRDPESLLPGPAREASHGNDAPADPGSARGGLAALTGSVHLTMPVSAWLDLSHAPGEVAGFGPLDAWTCRDLAARLSAGPGTRWCVTLTGPDGTAAAHACARAGPSSRPDPGQSPGSPGSRSSPGSPAPAATGRAAWLAGMEFAWLERGTCAHTRQAAAYRPPGKLRELVTIRHRTCGFPGCRRPARRCDLDHTRPYDQGGKTCECNLEALCRVHHQAKQAPGWHLSQPQPGILTWTTPHGREYTVTPDLYPV